MVQTLKILNEGLPYTCSKQEPGSLVRLKSHIQHKDDLILLQFVQK